MKETGKIVSNIIPPENSLANLKLVIPHPPLASVPWNQLSCVEPLIEGRTAQDGLNEVVQKRICGLLNRITPDNFELLLSQILLLPISSPNELDSFLSLLLRKVVDEELYCGVYAQLCQSLHNYGFLPEDGIFRDSLVAKCRQVINYHVPSINNNEESRSEEEYLKKRRLISCVRFVGELGSVGLVTAEEIYDVLGFLRERKLAEAACKLLMASGKTLEDFAIRQPEDWSARWREAWDGVLRECSEGNTRTRLMRLDLEELRAAGWIHPRPSLAPPKPALLCVLRKQFETSVFGDNWESLTGDETVAELEKKLCVILKSKWHGSLKEAKQCFSSREPDFIYALTKAVIKFSKVSKGGCRRLNVWNEESKLIGKHIGKRNDLESSVISALKDFCIGKREGTFEALLDPLLKEGIVSEIPGAC